MAQQRPLSLPPIPPASNFQTLNSRYRDTKRKHVKTSFATTKTAVKEKFPSPNFSKEEARHCPICQGNIGSRAIIDDTNAQIYQKSINPLPSAAEDPQNCHQNVCIPPSLWFYVLHVQYFFQSLVDTQSQVCNSATRQLSVISCPRLANRSLIRLRCSWNGERHEV